MRFKKLFFVFALLLMLIPAVSVSAATGTYTTNVTSNSLSLYWTLQPGEGYVNIYKDGVYLSSMAGNGISVTGLSACTYLFI